MKKTGQKFLCMMICLVLLLQLLPATAFAAEVASGTSGLATWTLDEEGVFTISGGEMENYASAAEQPWASYANQIKKAVIGKGIIRLGDYAFANCVNLTEVSIGSDVTTIGICAFENTTSLTEAVMPKNVKVFCDGMFHNSGIKKLYVLSRYTEFEGFWGIDAIADEVLPVDTVIYCYYSSHAHYYFNRSVVILDDDGLISVNSGSSTFAYDSNSSVHVVDLWKASAAPADAADSVVLDYTFSFTTDEAARIHNELVTPDKYIGPDYYNNGHLALDVSIMLRQEDSYENQATIYAGAYYDFFGVSLTGRENKNFGKWGAYSDEESIVTVTGSAEGVTVRINATMEELYAYLCSQEGVTDPHIDSVSIFVGVEGSSDRFRSGYEYNYHTKAVDAAGISLLDAHGRESYMDKPPEVMTLDQKHTVEDWAPARDVLSDAEYAKFYEPVSRQYTWDYRISREGWFYDEETGEDFYPGQGFWELEEGMFTETYNGVLYGGVAGTYDAGSDATVSIREMLPPEHLAFVETLRGVKARGMGGEVSISLRYTLTLTYEDGGVLKLTCDLTNETVSIAGVCIHTCRVCGLCASENIMACNSRYGWRVNECSCDTPDPAIVPSAVNDAWIADSEVWCGEVAARVETFDVEMAVTTDYFKAIVNSIGSSNVAVVYDITLYNEYGEAYEINEWGGTEEYVTLTIPVSAEVVEAAVNGELTLYHVDENGIAEPVTFVVNSENSTLTFTGYSFSPYVLVQKPGFYGRQALSQLPNGEALVYAYDQIAEGIENTAANISVHNGVDSLSAADIHTVWSAYNQDHGGVFWRGNSYSYSYNSSGVTAVLPTYLFTGAELEGKQAEMEAKVAEILAGITPEMGEYEKALYLHDRLAAIVTYVDGPNAHNAYGALVEGEAVCEGYAEAYQYLLQQVGIQSHNIIGSSYNAGTGAYEGHEWTCARINGKYYHIDVTWDDQEEVLYHAYFGLSDARIQEDHVIEVPAYDLPVCDSGEALYFRGKPELLETYTAASVAELLQNNGGTVHVYIPGDVQTFANWYYANVYEIATQMGLNGFTSSWQYLGREFVLTLKAPQPAYIPGDINNDGKVNNKDASRLFQYLAGWDVEVDEAALDVNGDGKVNNKDATRLFQYLAGWAVEIR